MKIIIYRLLSITLIVDIIAAVLFLTLNKIPLAILSLIIFIATLGIQISIIKCRNFGCRPGLRLLAIWTLLLDFELYIADTLLIKECPKCKNSLLDVKEI